MAFDWNQKPVAVSWGRGQAATWGLGVQAATWGLGVQAEAEVPPGTLGRALSFLSLLPSVRLWGMNRG